MKTTKTTAQKRQIEVEATLKMDLATATEVKAQMERYADGCKTAIREWSTEAADLEFSWDRAATMSKHIANLSDKWSHYAMMISACSMRIAALEEAVAS